MKRFYKQALVSKNEKGFGLELDGKPVKTSAGNILFCESERLAQHLADEWQAQEKDIVPNMMPVNQLVMTALDSVRSRAEIEAHILSFVDTDLLYYRADTSPYREKQADEWGRWVEWFGESFGIKLKSTHAIEALTQDKAAHDVFKAYLEKLNMFDLIAFESVVEDTSSPLLTLAFFKESASADDVFNAVFIDDMIRAEIYNEAQYGAAPDQEKKRKSVRANLSAAEKILGH